jgi:hypothetical protein
MEGWPGWSDVIARRAVISSCPIPTSIVLYMLPSLSRTHRAIGFAIVKRGQNVDRLMPKKEGSLSIQGFGPQIKGQVARDLSV